MPKIRLYIEDNFAKNRMIELDIARSHYLKNVMRVKLDDLIYIFNQNMGEYSASIDYIGKKNITLKICDFIKKPLETPNIILYFSPLKNTPLHFLIQKATELGVLKLVPVITERTNNQKINIEKLSLIALEAAEQCERFSPPIIEKPIKLKDLAHINDRKILICDETGRADDIFTYLNKSSDLNMLALLIGPEGGFSEKEFELLGAYPHIDKVCLGPRILRAETAAITALSCCMLKIGDWDLKPEFIYDN